MKNVRADVIRDVRNHYEIYEKGTNQMKQTMDKLGLRGEIRGVGAHIGWLKHDLLWSLRDDIKRI